MDVLAAWCHPEPVTPSDDLSQPRRPIFFPVVIATVFLTIIGMTAGFLLGERSRAQGPTGPQDQQQQQPVRTYQSSPSPNFTTAGALCPPETRRAAGELGLSTDLRQVFKIQTNNGTTVWICGDPDGGLYYQSKTGGLDADLVQKKNGLFLEHVREQGGHYYRAVAANGNEFLVDKNHLEVRFTDGRVQEYPVVAAE
jgi:hypothetical protein